MEIDMNKIGEGPHWLSGKKAREERIAEARAKMAARYKAMREFNPSQPRDEMGRWTDSAEAASADRREVIAKPSSGYKPKNPAGKDTQEKHRDEAGWTPERQELHKAIIGELAKGVGRSAKPTVFMTGGGPASWKSTLMNQGHFVAPENAMHVDADEIKKSLPEYREMVASRDATAAAFAHEESSHVSKLALKHAGENSLDVLLDSTGDSSFESLKTKIDKMRAGGHAVEGHYVTVDTEEAVARSNARGEKTGRMFPESVVRQIHASVSEVLPKAIEAGLFDKVTLWDTNKKDARKVVSAQGSKMTIHDQDLWDKFLAKAKK